MTSVDVSVGVHSLSMKFSAMLFHPERRALRRKSLDGRLRASSSIQCLSLRGPSAQNADLLHTSKFAFGGGRFARGFEREGC